MRPKPCSCGEEPRVDETDSWTGPRIRINHCDLSTMIWDKTDDYKEAVKEWNNLVEDTDND